MTYVKVIERRPPPAPARAWAMLSPCWAADATWAIASLLEVDGWDMIVFSRWEIAGYSTRMPRSGGMWETAGLQRSWCFVDKPLSFHLDTVEVFGVWRNESCHCKSTLFPRCLIQYCRSCALQLHVEISYSKFHQSRVSGLMQFPTSIVA